MLPAARADLIEIADFIALDSPESAVSFIAEIEAQILQTAERPGSFPAGTNWARDCVQRGTGVI